ncbi:MAG: hypothetical protein Q4G04_00795 [bacterium]|nr:hypothetical protein [bacterium]
MKKKIVLCLIALFMCFGGIKEVSAANGYISVNTSSSSVVVGKSFNVTVTVSSNAPLGTWEYSLNYDSSKLRLTSSNATPHIVDYGNGSKKSVSYSYTFVATASGSATVSIKNGSIIDYESEQEILKSAGSTSVKILTQAEVQASYSSNNYLSQLAIAGVEISPEFAKETMEYEVELEAGTTSIEVSGKAEDSRADVEGLGKLDVTDGVNNINITVTAENGNTRVYTIKATVKELNPVVVTVDNKQYTVIRKKTEVEVPSYYTETTVNINDEDVLAYENTIIGIKLVLLKDESGKILWFIYDEESSSFMQYKEIKTGNITLYIIEDALVEDINEMYKKTSINVLDTIISAFKIKDTDKFALVYGVNVETNEKGWYSYDIENNTLQRYNENIVDILTKQLDKSNLLILILIIINAIFVSGLIVMIILNIRKRKFNKKSLNSINTKRRLNI